MVSPNAMAHADEQWSPTTRWLVEEVRDLDARMHADGFDVHRVMFNLSDWDDTPRRAVVNGHTIRFGGFTTQHHDTITVIDGSGRQRVNVRNVADRPADAE